MIPLGTETVLRTVLNGLRDFAGAIWPRACVLFIVASCAEQTSSVDTHPSVFDGDVQIASLTRFFDPGDTVLVVIRCSPKVLGVGRILLMGSARQDGSRLIVAADSPQIFIGPRDTSMYERRVSFVPTQAPADTFRLVLVDRDVYQVSAYVRYDSLIAPSGDSLLYAHSLEADRAYGDARTYMISTPHPPLSFHPR